MVLYSIVVKVLVPMHLYAKCTHLFQGHFTGTGAILFLFCSRNQHSQTTWKYETAFSLVIKVTFWHYLYPCTQWLFIHSFIGNLIEIKLGIVGCSFLRKLLWVVLANIVKWYTEEQHMTIIISASLVYLCCSLEFISFSSDFLLHIFIFIHLDVLYRYFLADLLYSILQTECDVQLRSS